MLAHAVLQTVVVRATHVPVDAILTCLRKQEAKGEFRDEGTRELYDLRGKIRSVRA